MLKASIVLLLVGLASATVEAQERTHVHTTAGTVVSVPGPGEAHGSTAIGQPLRRAADDGPRLVRTGPYHEVYGRPSTRAELALQVANGVRPAHELPRPRFVPVRPRFRRTEWRDSSPPTHYVQVGPTLHSPPTGRIVKPRR